MSGTRPRTIRESQEYAEAKEGILNSLGKAAHIFDEVQQTFDYILARKPEFYRQVKDGLGVRAFETRRGVLPSMYFWYAYNEQYVDLLYVELVGNGEED